jgi:hypothetical protein
VPTALVAVPHRPLLDALITLLQVGDDVEFTLVRDSQAAAKDGSAKKLAAVRCGHRV